MGDFELSSDELMHYGVKRRSGRYPWGSGEHPFQRSGDFLARVEELESDPEFVYVDTKGEWGPKGKEYKGQTGVAHSLGLSSTELRVQKGLAKDERRAIDVATAKSLVYDKGLSKMEAGRRMGINESTVRSLLDEVSESRMKAAKNTADKLREEVESKGTIDISKGVERYLDVSSTKLEEARYILEREGYNVYGINVPQPTNPGQFTVTKVLAKKDITYPEAYKLMKEGKIEQIDDVYSPDHGTTFISQKPLKPESISSDRVFVKLADDVGPDGTKGVERDGVIFVRPGVEDLSLGNSTYAQVRILVDGNKYLKGMATYSDDIPDGYDLLVNSNKKTRADAFKDAADDEDNPFGSNITRQGQNTYIGKDGKEHLGAINKLRETGTWDGYDNSTISAQMLGKQSTKLAKAQLDISYADKVAQHDEIMSYTNATLKRHLLAEFADNCDSAAAHLEAAALPRQKWHVIMPAPSLKDNEVYAPNYKDGETLALVRYPHGGTFEIPIVKVNNKNPEARKMIGTDAPDAICINSKVAERLSGADFDGDTVMAIPTNSRIKIKSTNQLPGLKDFDPHSEYATTKVDTGKKDADGKPIYDYQVNGRSVKILSKQRTQTEMGKISNLITDMTIRGATNEELARAVRHSMVIIDASKHKLDYKQSYYDNDIATLKKMYQGHYLEDGRYSEGAATLLSRANAEINVVKRKGSPNMQIMKETGKKVYKESYEEYILRDKKTGEPLRDKDGNIKTDYRKQKSRQMYEVDDARELSTGSPMEEIYADYANHMKSLAQQSRKEIFTVGKTEYSKEAAKKYAQEVSSLNSHLNEAEKNAPRERRASVIANSRAMAKKNDDPTMTNADFQKLKAREMSIAREEVGASGKGSRIYITDREWEAIQAGAISDSKLSRILTKADPDRVKQLASPSTSKQLSSAKIAKIETLRASGYTIAEIADDLGISTTTVSKYL